MVQEFEAKTAKKLSKANVAKGAKKSEEKKINASNIISSDDKQLPDDILFPNLNEVHEVNEKTRALNKRREANRIARNKSRSSKKNKPLNHLLGIKGLTLGQIEYLLDLSIKYIEHNKKIDKKTSTLKGITHINLFFEASTRTQSSFELAGKRLGADVVNMSIGSSSVKKGETLIDTAMTLNAMKPDILVVRHSAAGAAELLSQKVSCSVINAGDGSHEHPTQALLDALTIKQEKGSLSGLKVAICGDVLHSRVARSNIMLLKMMGSDVNIVAPSTLIPSDVEKMGGKVYSNMKEGLKGCDIIMMLRLQMERMQGAYIPSKREYFRYYGLDETKLNYAKKDALVMHPGPINRGVEIDSIVADHVRSLIQKQVEMGVAVRMAILDALCNQARMQNKKLL